MVFTFTSQQVADLRASISTSLAQFGSTPDVEGVFTPTYDLLIGMITEVILLYPGREEVPASGVDQYVWAWVRGAREVNADNGVFSDFIRDYTEAQYLARYGTGTGQGELQRLLRPLLRRKRASGRWTNRLISFSTGSSRPAIHLSSGLTRRRSRSWNVKRRWRKKSSQITASQDIPSRSRSNTPQDSWQALGKYGRMPTSWAARRC